MRYQCWLILPSKQSQKIVQYVSSSNSGTLRSTSWVNSMNAWQRTTSQMRTHKHKFKFIFSMVCEIQISKVSLTHMTYDYPLQNSNLNVILLCNFSRIHDLHNAYIQILLFDRYPYLYRIKPIIVASIYSIFSIRKRTSHTQRANSQSDATHHQ